MGTMSQSEAKEKEKDSVLNAFDVYNVGDYVEIQGTKKNTVRSGYIRFKGNLPSFGECAGIELDEKINDGNNGTFNDQQYFECQEGKGTFIKFTKIIQKIEKKENCDTFPAKSNIVDQSEEDQIKHKKKKKKKEELNKGKKPRKSATKLTAKKSNSSSSLKSKSKSSRNGNLT